ncbi:hypothetical protein B0T24DRAFT_592598 [Lasiosphaeria ovina]|uniref:Fungal N-terminal domain-containing protein n=1 Tax=Lasiosphaeria ovina TaxID=92902 RepID=A0AAE0KI67_9PEZI|nr:hypothetical protein B0T24DRAFT_592598 [Lasiosphaeria ovina]
MDPVTIATTILQIAAKCVSVTKQLSDLRRKFTHSTLTITAICTESSVINASLSRLQDLFLTRQDEVFGRFQGRPELASACDTSLTGCMLLYSCLHEEVETLHRAITDRGDLSTTQKILALWKESEMKELLVQIRGQATALSFLLQCLQTESAIATRQLLEGQGDAINQIRRDIRVLRATYPGSEKQVPESVLGERRTAESIFGDNASTLDTAEFSFDDQIVNARAYRSLGRCHGLEAKS